MRIAESFTVSCIRGDDLRKLKIHQPVSLAISMRLGRASSCLDNSQFYAHMGILYFSYYHSLESVIKGGNNKYKDLT